MSRIELNKIQVVKENDIMIGFSIMMWFVLLILLFVSISLLRGNYSSMHGEVFNNTNDKEGYAKAVGKPVLVMALGILVSGIVAIVTSKILISVILIVCVAVIIGIWFMSIQRRFS